MRFQRVIFLLTLLAVSGGALSAQEARVRSATKISMPTQVDSNSPAFWRDGRLFWFGSHGRPWLSEGPNQFGPWETREIRLETANAWPHWMESVWPEDNGVLWGWYHCEPTDLLPDSTLTAPKVGAVVSFDGGNTLRDLGIVLESGDALDPSARNGYFAGGHGDFSVLLDRAGTYFYFFFDNYGGAASRQGVCLARMAYADRLNPAGKVWKYYNGSWQEAGRGGRVTPVFPVRKSWQSRDPDAFWGPSVHWNTHLNCYVMLLNRAQGEPGWAQEGVYVSFCYDLSRPESWTPPQKILDKSQFPGWYFFYPQVMGLEAGGTDRRAGQTARLYVGGVSNWEIDFVAPPAAPFAVDVSASWDTAVGIKAGESAMLSLSVAGSAPFTYQWLKDGAVIVGATSATYTVPAATLADAGVYAAMISNALGTTWSRNVTLVVAAPPVIEAPIATLPPRPEAFLANLSVRARLGSERDPLSIGFVLQSAEPKWLVLRAIGPTLEALGVAGAEADPRLGVYDAAAVMTAENDNWNAADAPAFAALGAFALPEGSADAAVVTNARAGAGTALVHGMSGGVVLVELYDSAATTRSKIVNLSARGIVGAGDSVMIAGFHVSGTGSKRLLIRAVGPQLAAFGVRDPLPDPTLELYENGTVKIAESDDWDEALAPIFESVGAPAFPAGSRDAAMAVTLPADGNYTVIIGNIGPETGEALLEIYELP
jgi:hypothetical protein